MSNTHFRFARRRRRSMGSVVGGDGSGIRLRHALASAAALYREVIVNRQSVVHVARRMKLDQRQCVGVVRILRRHGMRSPERLALVAMRDWGMEDADIAEIFGRSVRWASIVRAQADEIRAEEPIDPALEYVDAGLQPGDPSPEEISRRAAELRQSPEFKGRFVGARRVSWLVPNYSWTNQNAFVSLGAA